VIPMGGGYKSPVIPILDMLDELIANGRDKRQAAKEIEGALRDGAIVLVDRNHSPWSDQQNVAAAIKVFKVFINGWRPSEVAFEASHLPLVYVERTQFEQVFGLPLSEAVDDLRPEKNRGSGPKGEGRPRGRKPKYNSDVIETRIFELMDHHGPFSPDDPEWDVQARLEEKLIEEFPASESTVRGWATKGVENWNKRKAGK
jgi:hypothetical protein